MEPFGLFQLLQNLLLSQGNLEEKTPPAEQGEKTPIPTPIADSSPTATHLEEKPNPAAAFLENHRTRSEKRKRK